MACSRNETRVVETRVVEVSPRSVLAQLSTIASPATNTDALNAAITESNSSGADIILPGGEYGFTGMTVPTIGRVKIRGAGVGLTVLRNFGDNPSIAAHGAPGTSQYLSEWGVSDLTLTTSRRREGQSALSVLLARTFSVRDVSILDHGVGVRHESGWDCSYDGVSVGESGIGWQFPSGNYAPSAPVGLRNCSGWSCETAVVIEDKLEALQWVGGDFAGCGRGLVLYGNQSRLISFHGINFERIRGEDIVVGDDNTGPAAITLSGCRFLRDHKGDVSVRFVRGDALTFYSSRWTNYIKAIDQGTDSGSLVLMSNTSFDVDQFLTSEQRVQPAGVINATHGASSVLLALDNASVLPAVTGSEGVTTKFLSGPGRSTVTDTDFAIAPAAGCMCVLHDQTDGSIRHAIRGESGWHVSAAYLPLSP